MRKKKDTESQPKENPAEIRQQAIGLEKRWFKKLNNPKSGTYKLAHWYGTHG